MDKKEIERLMEKQMGSDEKDEKDEKGQDLPNPDSETVEETKEIESPTLLEMQVKDLILPLTPKSEQESTGVSVIIDFPILGSKPKITFFEYTRPIAAREIKAIIRHLFREYRRFKSAQHREELEEAKTQTKEDEVA